MISIIYFLIIGLMINFNVSADTSKEPYIKCMAVKKDQGACLKESGRDNWMPYKTPEDCALVRQTLEMASNMNWDLSYKILFFNERCHRLGELHYKR